MLDIVYIPLVPSSGRKKNDVLRPDDPPVWDVRQRELLEAAKWAAIDTARYTSVMDGPQAFGRAAHEST